jgi:K+-transporting ATPase KdpF subunit
MKILLRRKYIMPWTECEATGVDCCDVLTGKKHHPPDRRSTLSRVDFVFTPGQLGVDRRMRPADGGFQMSALYLIAGAITLGLLIYLILALLKPEWFG